MPRIGSILAAGVSLLVLATPAVAQQTQTETAPRATNSDSVEQIVVTARRRQELTQDVPAVVNAVTGSAIEKLNIRALDDVTKVVPGLQMSSNTNGIGSVTTIRGVQFDVNVSGDNGTVQYYLNDAPVSSGVVLQSLFDISQIEVLRGPQGTLKGRSSPSGSINVGFRKPDLDEAGGYLMGTVATHSTYNLNGALNIPIVKDKLGIRLAGLVSDGDGNRVRPYNDPSADLQDRTRAGRVVVSADPFDGVFTLDFTYNALDRRWTQYDQVEAINLSGIDLPELGVNNPASVGDSPVAINAKDRLSADLLPNQVHQKIKDYNINASLGLWGQRLYYVGNWSQQHFISIDPADDAGLFNNKSANQYYLTGSSNPALALAPVVPLRTIDFAQPTDSRANGNTQEVRLQNEQRVAGIFDYVVGYLHYQLVSPTNLEQVVSGVASPLLPGRLLGVFLYPIQRFATTKEDSVFGNLTAHIGENTELSGGVRHIWFKTDSGLNVCGLDFTGCVESPSVHVNESREATTFQLSAKHKFTHDIMGYVSYATAWRPDSIFIGGPTVPFGDQSDYLATKPEKSKNIEAGVKTEWLGGRLRLNVSGFYQKFTNFPYRVPGPAGTGVYNYDAVRGQVRGFNYIAGVPVEVKGVEGDIGFDITHNWNFTGTFAYADGKIKKGNIPCNDLDGNGVPDALLSAPSAAAVLAAYGTPANGGIGVATCKVTMRANAAPPFVATIQSEYRHDIGHNAQAFLRGLYSFNGSSQGDPTNPYDDVSSYGLLNLYAGVRSSSGGWEVTAYAKNLTNTFRALTRGNTKAFTPVNFVNTDTSNYFNITTTAPREFGITARFAFGSR